MTIEEGIQELIDKYTSLKDYYKQQYFFQIGQKHQYEKKYKETGNIRLYNQSKEAEENVKRYQVDMFAAESFLKDLKQLTK